MKKSRADIMIVEDEPALGQLLVENLRAVGYGTCKATNGFEAIDVFRSSSPDLCILDVMMPRMNGFNLARELRKIDPNVVFIFLTARDSFADKEEGFQIGCDDYITKPFRMAELLLRIKAVLTRVKGSLANNQPRMDLGVMSIRTRDRVLEIGGEDISLTAKEVQILELLAINSGATVSRKDILERVWGKDDTYYSKSLDVYLSRIRKYLRKTHGVKLKNVYGLGFSLVIDQNDQTDQLPRS